MPNITFHFDRISFWLGFLAATLFWWLFLRIRPMLPMWRQRIRQFIELMNVRNVQSTEDYLRRETLRRAQCQHIAAPLFSLDEILIEPHLLVPPGGQNPEDAGQPQPIAAQVIPYLPDWPELSAPLGVPTMTLAEALSSGRNLVIIGQPGSGKTVALAHLATQITRHDPSLLDSSDAAVLYVQIHDLDTTLAENRDPSQNLLKCIQGYASAVMQPQIPRFFQSITHSKQRKVVLILDGLDELNQEELSGAVSYLRALLKRLPRLQIITSGSADYIDGLAKTGFYPLALAAWTIQQRTALAHRWSEVWMDALVPEAQKKGKITTIDPLIMNNWLDSETTYLSPLEWTMRLWGAFAGDLSGSSGINTLHTHITRFLAEPDLLPALEELALDMVHRSGVCINYDDAERLLSAYNPATAEQLVEAIPVLANVNSSATVSVPDPQDEQVAAPTQERRSVKKGHRDNLSSRGEKMIRGLQDGGVLVEHSRNRLRFTSPVFLGFLSGMKIDTAEAGDIVKSFIGATGGAPSWVIHLLTLHYAAACSEQSDWIYPLLENVNPPFFRNLFYVARWLPDAPSKAEWRTWLMRNLISLIQNETLPLGIRARAMAAFYLSRDPSSHKLFKQLLTSRSPAIRRLALMGCGASGSPQVMNDVLELLVDANPDVRYTACLALAAIPKNIATAAVEQVLLTGDEAIRQAAAEALAQNAREGYKALEEAVTNEDILTRRAAVFGLAQVHANWAQKALEKLAVEDGHWVVRNAAAQALQGLQKTDAAIPPILSSPAETGWLLAFASKLGMGILPGQPATDVLMMVLKSGSVEEQIAALHYLREQPDEGIIAAIYSLLDSDAEELREPIVYSLWWIAISGVSLPSPQSF